MTGSRPPDAPPLSSVLAAALADDRAVALATVVEDARPGRPAAGAKRLVSPDADPVGTLGDPDLDRVVTRDALGELEAGRTGVRHYGPRGEARERVVSVFIEAFAPAPRMLIFGAVDFTGALVRAAKLLGFHVTVGDAREVFATTRRFPFADEVVVDWPHRILEREGARLGPRDAVCVLTHDPKFDVPAITTALDTAVGYIGVMGSRRTHADREVLLRAAGVGDDDLRRLRSPIGLDLGARTPEEVAVAVLAEIIASRTGRTAAPLATTEGPLH